ncbi:MAG: hypothetical protein A3H27_18090 [Acidobacteria bacterium RIFCSPLOWO2_02_FULL_59_13]|nr:MAG: hypothetical protein A3H27_18090 [Acidobacteria bacterium RIFCSPLOWO2_02_FULL_59_13]
MKYSRLVKVVVLLLVLATAISVYAATVTCPIDKSSSYFTGKTKVDVSGKLLWLYKCNLYGHEFWVVK